MSARHRLDISDQAMDVLSEYHTRMSWDQGEVYTASTIVFRLRGAKNPRVEVTADWDVCVKESEARVTKSISDKKPFGEEMKVGVQRLVLVTQVEKIFEDIFTGNSIFSVMVA